ncbi:NAD(P)-dependent oxidoreductase [Fluviibacterium sp. DFM31]|uniref:NAD(P)-dependent oxidoreductase n=1 Tax=Meridianimarinicoccus marinus TaxID=3231483 RepID=A0ABV3L6J8_9RHOB
MRVLLTGATGLIGRQTARALYAAGHEVLPVSRHGQGGLTCDLLDAGAVDILLARERPEGLVHLAWHAGVADRWTSPANLDWAAATLHLARRFAQHGGRRAVFAGSCAEYDWSVSELSEDSPLRPATPYGAAKAGTGLALCGAGPALNLSLAWGRIFFVHGLGEPRGRLLGDLIAGLRAGERVACTDGLQERDFLQVEDLARALVAVLDSDLQGPVNIASGQAIAVRDLIGEVARQLGGEDLVDLGARPRPASDPARLAADTTRLASIGFRPRHDLTSAVAATLTDGSGPA